MLHTIKALPAILLLFFTTAVLPGEKTTYKNREFGFTFEYPSTYQLGEHGGWISIDLNGKNRVYGHILELDECIERNLYFFRFLFWLDEFRSCAIDIARQWCEAEGLFGESYCIATKSETQYKSEHGASIIQLHFVNIHEVYETGIKEKRIAGPIFIADISRDSNHQRALIFGLARDRPMEKARYVLIRNIVRTIRLEK